MRNLVLFGGVIVGLMGVCDEIEHMIGVAETVKEPPGKPDSDADRQLRQRTQSSPFPSFELN